MTEAFEYGTTRETNPASGRAPGPPKYNTSALNHSATLPVKNYKNMFITPNSIQADITGPLEDPFTWYKIAQ